MKIFNLDLQTNDLNATRHFYASRLGVLVLVSSSSQLTVAIGWTHLTFRAVSQPIAPYHFAINVPRGALEMLMYYLNLPYLTTQPFGDVRRNAVVEFPAWRAKACYFQDPAGNLLKLVARNDLHLDDPNLTFDQLFQGVSEIGIATEDVAHTTAELQRRFAVPQFAKQSPASNANALGDDNGLFMLAQVGRPWLFTNVAARTAPCRVRFVARPGEPVQELHAHEINRLTGHYRAVAPSVSPAKPRSFFPTQHVSFL